MTPLAVDLFAGTCSGTVAFQEAGWDVLTVDNDPQWEPDLLGDIRDPDLIPHLPRQPDFLWASPPCIEFARESMPWCRTGRAPDLSCVEAVRRIVAEVRPRWWVMENVRGAQRWLGRAVKHVGPFYLWGDFPPMDPHPKGFRKKESYSSTEQARRAMLPRALSEALRRAVEAAP